MNLNKGYLIENLNKILMKINKYKKYRNTFYLW